DRGQRVGRPPGPPRARVRAVLHDEAGRRRHRARAPRGPGYHPQAWGQAGDPRTRLARVLRVRPAPPFHRGEADDHAKLASLAPPMSKPAKSGPLVLYVDDESGNRVVFEQSTPEFNVVCVSSGPEALKVMGQQPVAVLVTDMRMPEMSGEELLR